MSDAFFSGMAAKWFRGILLIFMLALPVTGFSQLVTVQNYVAPGYLFDSNADAIAGRAQFSRTAFSSEVWTLRFRLLYPDGAAVTLRGVDGEPVDEVIRVYNVNPGVPNHTVDADLRPYSALQGGVPYRVSVFFDNTDDTVADENAYTYVHFQDTDTTRIHVVSVAGEPQILESIMFEGLSEMDGILVEVPYTLYRYDVGGGAQSVNLTFGLSFEDDLGAAVAAVDSLVEYASPVLAPVAGIGEPATISTNAIFRVTPNAQLDSVNRQYRVRSTIRHNDFYTDIDDSLLRFSNTAESPLTSLAHYNGSIVFGSGDREVRATIQSVAGTPLLNWGGAGVTGNVNFSARLDGNPDLLVPQASRALRLVSNGDAVYEGGDIFPSFPPNTTLEQAGIVLPLAADAIELGQAGATLHNLRIRLPGGAGITDDPTSPIASSLLPIEGAYFLDNDLALTNATIVVDLNHSLTLETVPVWINVPGVLWDVEEGTLLFFIDSTTYVRADAVTALQAVPQNDVVNPEALIWRDNTGYFRTSAKFDDNVLSLATGEDGEALLTGVLMLDQGGFLPHYPKAMDPVEDQITFGNVENGGRIEWVDSRPVMGGSYLTFVNAFGIEYSRSCGAEKASPCPPDLTIDVGRYVMSPHPSPFAGQGNILYITEDGGLFNAVDILMTPFITRDPLAWGRLPHSSPTVYAHQHETAFTQGHYVMPGFALLQGIADLPADVVEGPDVGPGVLLLSGVVPSEDSTSVLFERPGLDQVDAPILHGYSVGLGHYPGLNLQVGDSDRKSTAQIGDTRSEPFSLHSASKYILRPAGVSGRHQAKDFPFEAKVYGYDMAITRFGLGFLVNKNVSSMTSGALAIPAPVDLTFAFDELTFSCSGEIKAAEIAASQQGVRREMGPAYWRAHIYPQRYIFAAEDPCVDVPRFGVYAQAFMSLNPEVPMSGGLGFNPNGQLLRPIDDNVPDILQGRLALPSAVQLPGAEDEPYTFYPAYGAFFNHAADTPGMDNGYLVLNGALDVAFFANLNVQIHTEAREDGVPTNTLYAIMRTDPDLDIFQSVPNDIAHLGRPVDMSVAAYRQSAAGQIPNDKYRPRGRRGWMGSNGFFDFDFIWDSADRSFRADDAEVRLVILNTVTRVKYLNAKRAHIEFGIDYGIPKVTIPNLAIGSTRQGVDIASSVARVLGNEAQKKVHEFVDARAEWLDRKLTKAIERAVEQMFEEEITPLLNHLKAQGDQAKEDLFDAIEDFATNTAHRLVANISDAMVTHLSNSLVKAEAAVDTFNQAVSPEGMAGLANDLLVTYTPATSPFFIPDDFPDEDNPDMVAIRQTGAELGDRLTAIQSQVDDQLRERLDEYIQQIDWDKVEDEVTKWVRGYIVEKPNGQAFLDWVDDPDAAAQRLVVQVVRNIIITSPPVRHMKELIDAIIFVAFDEYDQFVNGLGRVLMEVVIDGVKQQLGPLPSITTETLDSVRNWLGVGDINGSAMIVGDSLRELRVDGKLRWKVPDAMEVDGYILIREMHTDTDGGACVPNGTSAYEMIIAARNGKASWLAPNMRITKELRAILEVDDYGTHLVGLGGNFTSQGEVSLEGFKITRVGAFMGFAPDYGCYIAAALNMKFSDYEVGGGVFFGSTCSIEPLVMIDPDVADILGNPPFSGFYLYGEGRAPIINFGCPLRVTVGLGAGAFYFVEGNTYGFKAMGEVSGEAVCLISARGRLTLIGKYTEATGGKRLDGRLNVSGRAGVVRVTRNYGIRYQGNRFSRR